MKNHLIMAPLLLLACLITARASATPAPEFTQIEARDWLNSGPLTLNDLKGKIVLLDFWTFSCWNCYRSFPWLNTLDATIDDPRFQIIGVHSPEFEREKDRAEVARQADGFGLTHPIMIDNAFAYWRAIGNRFWPTFYLIDGNGTIRETFIGETHSGDRSAKKIEAAIKKLLIESEQARAAAG